ncbi:hypothetical protein L210DRAFT_3499616 [Boletus edulis BED1]|uniref:Uncharacterized protein n=1 Tax=Boletus edulis BED1 TaxID=1328754 RepID=A0AAD4GME7_BOLED|nr:hypothetical protein L210DRAFT_3499616 [Boletus edulis BED1]
MAFVEILATETSEDEGDITMEWYIARVGDYPPLVVFLVFILSLAVLVYARVIILLVSPGLGHAIGSVDSIHFDAGGELADSRISTKWSDVSSKVGVQSAECRVQGIRPWVHPEDWVD